ncbi:MULTISPECIES: type II toxin-antitoxin system PemK/MazF family toxin [Paenibacillus]|jgi:mRNA-degrading endonuclease toxin of MazEF toxin-antitoxin module|uniref:Type II toxin-antitoxin system PemK/MazF family toxin n=2 Tax=Paenibacillus TaxID=44249 RepID=A0A919Y1Z0_9BACL|nr:hypothetical protein J41TS4_20120 [Paenibacillus apis]
MTNSTRTFKRGSVWIAEIVYRDDVSKSKKRPVVVLMEDNQDEDLLIAPITSSYMRNHWDINLLDWKLAGLVFPSYVRTSKLSSVHYERLKHEIGILTDEDLQAVLNACRSLFL